MSRKAGDITVLVFGLGIITVLLVGIFFKFITRSSNDSIEVKSPAPQSTQSVSAIEKLENTLPESVEEEVAISGRVGRIYLTALNDIPTRQNSGLPDMECEIKESNSTSPAALAAKASGWNVVGDEIYARFQVVMVISGSLWNADNGCLGKGASMLFFLNGKLQAVAYDGNKNWSNAVLVGMNRVSADRMRLFASNGALAEVVFGDNFIELVALPKYDFLCEDRAQVPRLERTGYIEARKELITSGWSPAESESSAQYSQENDKLSQEIKMCETVGKCRINFLNESRDMLTILVKDTPKDANENGQFEDGEFPSIDNFYVTCREN